MVNGNKNISLNLEQFNSYVSNIEKLDSISSNVLSELILQFPYFQTARLLYLKSLHNQKNINFDNQLKLTATYVNDRKILYKLINDPSFVKEICIVSEIENKEIEPKIKKEEIAKPEKKSVEDEVKKENNGILKPEIKITEKKIVKKERKLEIKPVEALKQIESNKLAITKTPVKRTLADDIIKKVAQIKQNKRNDNEFDAKKESIADIILKKKKDKEKVVDIIKTEIIAKKVIEEKIENKPEIKDPVKIEEKQIKKDTEFKAKMQEERKKSISFKLKDDVKKEELLQFEYEDNIEEQIKEELIYDDDLHVETYSINNYFELEDEVEQEVSSKEDKKDVNKDNFSFSDWLDKINSTTKAKQKFSEIKDKNKESLLISKFIEADPSIKPLRKEFDYQNTIIDSGIETGDEYITETLAGIYIKQELYNKAINAYKKLSLKYPEKNIYFANQIKKVKELIKNK